MKIAVDFDGVIAKSEGIPTNKFDWNTREPVFESLEAINHLIKIGHTVWVFTSNEQPDEVRNWLARKGFPDMKVTNIKEPAHVYIDDRAVRFTNWQDIRRYFG